MTTSRRIVCGRIKSVELSSAPRPSTVLLQPLALLWPQGF